MRIGSMFSGTGGLDMAVAQAFGARTSWVADIDEGACKVLAHRFPHAPNLGDVSVIEWTPGRAVDIITAGFPCQDVSTAGGRAGLAAGKRSGLWVEVIRAARELQPTFIALENVRGLLSAEGELPSDDLLALGDDVQRLDRILRLIESKKQRAIREGSLFHVRQHSTDFIRLAGRRDRTLAQYRAGRARLERAMGVVLRDLADLGFDAEWRGLRASDVGACHQRFRVFVLAWRRDVLLPYARHDAGCSELGIEHALQAAGAGQPSGGPDLTLLPTPMTAYTASTHAEWRARRPAGNGAPRELCSDLRIVAEELLPTPNSSLASSGGSQHPDKLRAGGHQVKLKDAIEHLPTPLLPTPNATEGRKGTTQPAETRRAQGHQVYLSNAIGSLLPTPRATDGTKGGPNQRGSSGDLMLPSAVATLPTPAAGVFNDGEDVATWQARRERVKAELGNGNGFGMPLGIAVAMLPTPQAEFRDRSEDTARDKLDGAGDFRDLGSISTLERFGQYAPAIARQEAAFGYPAPSPTEPGKSRPRLSARFCEWMMGLPPGWITDVPDVTRNEALKLAGNGVVPPQAAAALRDMLPYALAALAEGQAA